ncbi:sulfurtransferase [Microbacterium sp. ASV49]|uniref:Sulfurtransferase n=1 Tax=Microbacterium candidum TaxID=3041922 RepID=A0ABT7N1V7_9MICO|nr:sulfurtransferase [Microbacterium sp. ASV49]MDL9980651.1 sulfurtransferase [Microbacterium sp. ASV49]
MSPIIAPSELASLLADNPPRLLDVRWDLARADGREAYAEGHLPGAVFVDMDTELSTHGRPEEGRHPLPSLATLQDAARRWGVSAGDAVVVYDDYNSVAAARAWWLLTRAGVADVRVLDGGLRGWIASGFGLEVGDVVAAPGDVVLRDFADGTLTLTDAAQWPASGVLIDARAAERYRGETEPMDPIAGHIPGSVNVPATSLLEDGRFRSAPELRDVFAAVGVAGDTPAAAYCGSGVTAAHTALAGAVAGIEVAVYPGSWSAWSNTPGMPVATGAEPGGAVS